MEEPAPVASPAPPGPFRARVRLAPCPVGGAGEQWAEQ
ncbi:hypothetical protein EES37_12205 [Streptomyces sp. ADI91-18]|nr:hypothetical protein EES37_12205 [Streptomyces sp. ADI91-18]